MHVTPVGAPQQSAVTVHLSPTWLHVVLVEPQTARPASFVASQKPPQQSVPVTHVVPSAWQGSSAQ